MANERLLQQGLSIRGDSYYCPLALQLNSYFNCSAGCSHCYLRRLNRTWGQDLRPLDIDQFHRQIENGIESRSQSPLAHAIRARKTVYVGSKSDPYQPAELEHNATQKALRILLHHGFTVVIATMFTENLEKDRDLFERHRDQVIIMPQVSPGGERDWTILEHKKTTHPMQRLMDAKKWKERGFKVGINGEPFIPGFHTVDDFRMIVQLIRTNGLGSYNTYNLHFNDWNAKAMHEAGVDIEAVWEGNQDEAWAGTLQKLIQISAEEGVPLGCPDFVNSGKHYRDPANTCCGIDVPNPLTFNLITWKRMRQDGMTDEEIIEASWDGVGDKEYGLKLLRGEVKGLFTLDDVGRKSPGRLL